MKMTEVKELEPRGVWEIFASIAAVPRPSKQETAIRDLLRRRAEAAGFSTALDAIGNLVVRVPAKPGFEKAPVTVIQGHLDMVCEKNEATVHDFERDPIKLGIAEEKGRVFVTAEGTTLGADNGIGVAMGLAAALDPEVVHGPLELLMTIDEEAGMTGAKNLDPAVLVGRRMINLDSEDDAALFVGCAGGCDVSLSWTFQREAVATGMKGYKVTMRGLRGGHSGIDIHENRGNALKLLASLLVEAGARRIAGGRGGSLRNAIPREASLEVVGGADLGRKLEEAAARYQELARSTFHEVEAEVLVEPVTAPGLALSEGDGGRLLAALRGLPSGVIAVVPEIAGQILSSNNTATLSFAEQGQALTASVCCLARSADPRHLRRIVDQIRGVGELAGAEVTDGNEYPGWQPNMESPLLARTRALYAQTFGSEAQILAIHAGLECGILNERMDGQMDMISFGPTIQGAHSPDERVWVDSVAKIWVLFRNLLAELAQDR